MTELTAGLICEIVGGTLWGDSERVVNRVTTDSRKVEKGDLFVALKGEKFDGADFVKALDGVAGMAISSRYEDVDFPLIVVEDCLSALTELSKYYIENIVHPKIVVSLTGSVGKTTTKEMTSAVLSRKYNTARTSGNFNNHIGVPLTLLSVENCHDALVCEMGMSHKGEISHLAGLVKSDIAMITNIGHSHIENLGSRENIRDAKLEIAEGLKKGGVLIVNGDEPLLDNINIDGRVIRVGLNKGLDIWAEDIVMGQNSLNYTLHLYTEVYEVTLPCTGKHNVVDSLFAVAAGYVAGVDTNEIIKGLLDYKSVGFRQKIYNKSEVTVIADCYNAGIESMTASLSMLSELETKGKKIAVLGDMLELGAVSEGAHAEIGQKVFENKIDLLFTYGTHTNNTHNRASSLGVKSYHFNDKKELSDRLLKVMREGDTVLFKGSRGMKLEDVISLSGLEE
ncbi:MAG: UDP-N-acetylmuramoyl-tripeptide--D-alanyl-D-alanine ligase [Clostridia bacterium]|nr:UDP-N-acetylmuramoyl-tripeptide--D-alanyl-D-alanine ligase [Clostridia bacterium]